jgi:hypothetical protein
MDTEDGELIGEAQTMPAPPQPLPPGTTPFRSSSQRDGEWSRRRIEGSRRTGSVGEICSGVGGAVRE